MATLNVKPIPEMQATLSKQTDKALAPKRQKKGKKFINKESMLSIIEKVNQTEDSVVNKKRERENEQLALQSQREMQRVSKKQKKEEIVKKAKDSLKSDKKEHQGAKKMTKKKRN